MSINFFNEKINFKVKESKGIINWINTCVEKEGYQVDTINIIFTSDNEIVRINEEFLKRDYYTDIITFDYTEGMMLNGELFISIDMVKQNAILFEITVEKELLRVIIHGLLHMMGYKDSNKEEKKFMKKKEDEFLELY